MTPPIATRNFSPDNYATGLTPITTENAKNPDGLNPDLVVNGSFATDSDWTKGAGWAISAGVGAVRTPSAATDLKQTIAALDPNTAYLMVTTITGRTAGSVTPKIGTNAGTARSTNDTFYDIIQAQSDEFIYTPDASFDGTIELSKAIKVLEAEVLLKTEQGVLYSLQGHNNNAAAQYIQIFKSNSVVADGEVPFRQILVGPSADYEFSLPIGGDHSNNGWYLCVSTTNLYKTLGEADCTFVAQYK